MRYPFLILVAAAALFWVAPASAHGLIAHPRCASAQCTERSQKANLKHAKYLCNYGRHSTKRWGCAAVKWLTRELDKTETTLHPVVQVTSHYEGWLCIHSHEGPWNANTGNGYLGGLQMTPGWGGAARPDLLSPGAQIALADTVARSQGYADWWMRQQWPNTYPRCAGHFN